MTKYEGKPIECPWCGKPTHIDMRTRKIEVHLSERTHRVCVEPPLDEGGNGSVWICASAGLPTLGKDR